MCNAELEIDEQYAGQEVECGNCLQVFVAERPKRAEPQFEVREPRRPRRPVPRNDDDGYDPRRYGNAGSDGGVGLGVAALILGILSFPLICCSVFALPIQIGGVVCGVLGMRNSAGKGMAVTGLVLSLMAMTLTVTLLVIGIGANVNNWNNPPPVRRPGR